MLFVVVQTIFVLICAPGIIICGMWALEAKQAGDKSAIIAAILFGGMELLFAALPLACFLVTGGT